METITKSISVSPDLHKYLLDHKDSNKRSIEAVIYGLIGENDEMKKTIDELMKKIDEELK